MNHPKLAKLVERADVHERLLGDYDGPYSLGVTDITDEQGRHEALWLRVVGDVGLRLVYVEIDGAQVPVVIEGGQMAPAPLRA